MKKILLTALSVVLVAALAIGGTLAYLTDRDAKTNVFTVGNVDIELNEKFTQGSQLIPGVDVQKEVTVTNTGDNDAWVWVKIAIPSVLDNTTAASENALHFNYAEESVEEGKWNWMDKDGNWNYAENVNIEGIEYNVYTVSLTSVLKPGETTLSAMKKVYLDIHVDIDPDGNLAWVENGNITDLGWNIKDNPMILVSAYAIQAANFDDVYAAYDAYGTQWGTNDNAEFVIPSLFEYEGVVYVTEGDVATINSVGGDTIYRGVYSDGLTEAKEVVIGEGIKRLDNRALCKAPSITQVTLPDSLTYIDESVFQQSNITSIEIPENVTHIGKQAFGACSSLETIVIKAENVTIGNYVARDCANLKEVYIYSDAIEFETGSMYFTNYETGDAAGITFYVSNSDVAAALYNACTASQHYGMLIKSIDGTTTYYNTIK